MINFNDDIEALKDAIVQKEIIENILVKTSGGYHVVNGSVVDFWNDDYVFYFEGFGFTLSIDEILGFILIE